MAADTSTCPAPREKVVDLYFMEHRAKVIDIAAFLDRVDRAAPDAGSENDDDDVRLRALRDAIAILLDREPGRARRILDLFSDHTAEPIPEAHTKGAIGVDPKGEYSSAAAPGGSGVGA